MSYWNFRDSLEPLEKATRSEDFADVKDSQDPQGPGIVDHASEYHPPSLEPQVKHYRDNVLNGPKVHPNILHGDDMSKGISSKVILATASPTGPKKYIVKPYHEKVIDGVAHWQRYPIQGWAEMTTQHVAHAAGVPKLFAQAHIDNHEMSPGVHEPGLVIHVQSEMKSVGEPIEKGEIPKGMEDIIKPGEKRKPDDTNDVRKITLLHFLSNHLDGHSGNLLADAMGNVLSVDHSRSFQFANVGHHLSKKEVDSLSPEQSFDTFHNYMTDAFREGVVAVSDFQTQTHAKMNKPAITETPQFGETPPNPYGSAKKDPKLPHPSYHPDVKEIPFRAGKVFNGYHPIINQWWPSVRNKVVDSMEKRLSLIKEPKIQEHIRKNFMSRVDWLDDMSKGGMDKAGLDWHNKPVKWHLPGAQ